MKVFLVSVKNVLITGAHGFIGRYCAKIFAEHGYNVIGIGRGNWPMQLAKKWGISAWHEQDLSKFDISKLHTNFHSIIHCAGGASVGLSVANPENDFTNSVATTKNIIQYILQYSTKTRLVLASSAAVYGLVDKKSIPESAELHPVSPYGKHKKMAEDLILQACHEHHLQASIVRLFSIYGEGLKKQLLFDACQKIDRHENTFFGTGEETRDWLHVTDAASLMLKAAEFAAPTCPIINGGTGVAPSVQEVLSKVFSCFPQAQAPNFNGQVKAGDPPHYCADVNLARSWNWKAKISWENGIQDYCRWYQEGFK